MKITHTQARQYFAHPSQHSHGLTEADLPEAGFEYYADEGVCMAFNPLPWPGLWQAHIGVLRDAWGSTGAPTQRLLNEFWNDVQPIHIVIWIPQEKRHAIALAGRCGAIYEGRMAIGLEIYGWRP